MWNIYDARIHEAALSFEDYRQAHAALAVKSAHTLSELAALTQLPEDALNQTLTHVRALCEQNQTDEFGRTFGPEQQLQGPWFAIQVTGALFHTQGGLEIDAHGRVLRADKHQPLPNLFAGGGAARGVSGAVDSGYLSGNGLLSAVVMGTLAGRSAAELTRADPLP